MSLYPTQPYANVCHPQYGFAGCWQRSGRYVWRWCNYFHQAFIGDGYREHL